MQSAEHKTFDLNQPLDLPSPLSWRHFEGPALSPFEGAYLFIAPSSRTG